MGIDRMVMQQLESIEHKPFDAAEIEIAAS